MDNFCQGFCTLCGTGCAQYCRDYRDLRVERDKYKAALEKIASLKEGHQTLERLEVAREALK